jgi:hypothetical protein
VITGGNFNVFVLNFIKRLHHYVVC